MGSRRGKQMSMEEGPMKTVYCATLLTVFALTLSVGGWLGEAAAEALHTGKGTVLSVEGQGERILMTEEPRGTHVLSLTPQTTIVNAMGSAISAATLQPGDLIREECFVVGDGTFAARQIRLLRPAWMELAGPEM